MMRNRYSRSPLPIGTEEAPRVASSIRARPEVPALPARVRHLTFPRRWRIDGGPRPRGEGAPEEGGRMIRLVALSAAFALSACATP